MHIDLITMDRASAQKHFEAYRSQITDKRCKEDEALALGYKALAKGQKLLDLHGVMERVGTDHRGYPRLAIGRANAPLCWYKCTQGSGPVFTTATNGYGSPDFWRRGSFHDVTLPKLANFPVLKDIVLKSVVPIIPALHRPQWKLSNYHILWEADWEKVPIDPILLRHLHGALYVVLASWELTPLERAVLGGRLTG